jgi:hypothetical protein
MDGRSYGHVNLDSFVGFTPLRLERAPGVPRPPFHSAGGIALVRKAGLRVPPDEQLPEELIDPSRYPRAHAAAARCAFWAPHGWSPRYRDPPLDWYEAYGSSDDDGIVFGFQRHRGAQTVARVGGHLFELDSAVLRAFPEVVPVPHSVLPWRAACRHISGGELSLDEVMGAAAITSALHGSRGADEWEAPGRWLGGYERFLELLGDRAEAHLRDAEELVAILSGAAPDADTLEVPIYGMARRFRVPPISYQERFWTVRLASNRPPDPPIEIAGEDVFVVEDVEAWSPEWELPPPPANAWLPRPSEVAAKRPKPWWRRWW